MRGHSGHWLVVAAVGLVVASLGGSAITAATTDTPTPTDATLAVGLQGAGDGGAIEVYRDGDLTYRRSDAMSYHDVTWLADDRLLAAFVVRSDDCETVPAPCGETGFRILNLTSDEIAREWTFEVRSPGNSEVHDVEPLGDGRVALVDMDRERVLIVNASGTVTWQWELSTVYDTPADPTRTDWLHANDIDHLGDGRFLVSVRNTNQLLVVERGVGVVETVNRDHDRATLLGQHNPQWLGAETVLVADSENGRAVELHREDGAWVPRWRVGGAAGEVFRWPRDADRQPDGTTLITDSRNHRVVLVDADGNLVWEQPTGTLPYEADLRGGEAVGAPAIGSGGATAEVPEVPGADQALVLLHHGVGVPAWLTSWHLLVVFVAIVGGGEGILRIAERRGAGRHGSDARASATEVNTK